MGMDADQYKTLISTRNLVTSKFPRVFAEKEKKNKKKRKEKERRKRKNPLKTTWNEKDKL